MQHNGPHSGWITNASSFIFRRTVRGREEVRTLIKNSPHWRYETRFIQGSSARNCNRLTAEWFATSVNLPKWASSQIFATAHALNNSQYCTSLLFHFYLFSSLSTVRSPNHCHYMMRRCCISFSYGTMLIRRSLLGVRANNRGKPWGRKFKPRSIWPYVQIQPHNQSKGQCAPK